MTTPSEEMANRLELMSVMMRHPSQLDPELVRKNIEEFNAIRLRYPSLMTDDELNQAMKSAHELMSEMREHPYREELGLDDRTSDWITQLEAEHHKRFA